jgi:hypothetical protein
MPFQLHAYTAHGAITLHLSCTCDESQTPAAPFNVNASSSVGPVTLILERTPQIPAAPFNVNAWSSSGAVTVYLPRDFRGRLQLHGAGTGGPSSSLEENLVILSDINTVRQYLVGAYPDQANSTDSHRDVCTIYTTGSILVGYVDEFVPT